jgi:hypothetical protein
MHKAAIAVLRAFSGISLLCSVPNEAKLSSGYRERGRQNPELF